jgi:ribosomal protein L37AE/L43A
MPAAAYKPEPHFYCLRCEGDQFKLFSTGMVHCAHCGARMRNLSVADTPGAPGTEH